MTQLQQPITITYLSEPRAGIKYKRIIYGGTVNGLLRPNNPISYNPFVKYSKTEYDKNTSYIQDLLNNNIGLSPILIKYDNTESGKTEYVEMSIDKRTKDINN